jgi:hypothetical protein
VGARAAKGREGKGIEGNGISPAPLSGGRERDPIWDAVESLFWPDGIPKSETSRVGKVVRDLKGLNASVDVIHEKFTAMRWEEWGKHAPAESLVKNWSTLKASRGKAAVPDFV